MNITKEVLSEKSVVIVPNEGIILFILASINFTHIMDFVIMAPLNPFLKEVFHINTRSFGLLMSAYTLSAGIFGFLASFFIDKIDRKKALVILYIGFIVSNIFCSISRDYYFFMGSRVVAGAFGGILGALIMSIVGDAIPQERRGKATGIVMAAFSGASIIGIPTGLYLAAKYAWYAPFILISILASIILVVALIYFPSMKGHMTGKKEKPIEMLTSIGGNTNLRWALLFSSLLMLSGFSVVPFISDYMVNNVGLAKEDLSYIYMFGGLATVVSGPLVGKLSDKYGKQRTFTIAGALSILPILLITNLPALSKPLALVATTSFFIFFGARFVPAMALVTSSVLPFKRGSFMSINSSIQQLSSAAASFGAGLVIVNTASGALLNFGYVGIFAAITTLLCIFISFKVKPVS
ncbi:MAG TPA: MFS transporter [Cytophagaceae bacterium]|jgi:predicted MFS family arabinose efflux permease